MTNAGIKAVLKKAMLENEQISTAWMGFYLNIYLYILLVTNILVIPNALTGLYSMPIWVAEKNILELALFFIKALIGISAIGTFIELRDLTQRGYKWNVVYLCSFFVGISLSTISIWLKRDPGVSIKIGTLITSLQPVLLFWVVPNLIYFKKRKYLFRTYTTAEVAAAIKGEQPAPALPIRKPCRYQPTKAKVDMQKLSRLQAEGKATRLAQMIGPQKQT